MTAWDTRFNVMACYTCIFKRGHPNIKYEDNPKDFAKNYDNFKNTYYTPDEVIEIFKI